MSKLEKLVKDIVEVQKRAATDLDTIAPAGRPSVHAMIQDAKQELEGLEKQYHSLIRASTVGLFVFGPEEKTSAFVDISGAEAGTLAIKGDRMVTYLADRVRPTLGPDKGFGPTQLTFLIDGLEVIGKELGIRSMPLPKLATSSVTILDEETLRSYINDLVKEALGYDLLRLDINSQMNKVAVASLFSGSTLAITVTGLDKVDVAELASLFTSSMSVDVAEEDEVNQEYVFKALESMKKKMKSKTQNNQKP